MKRKPHSVETRKKISESLKRFNATCLKNGERNPNWKGGAWLKNGYIMHSDGVGGEQYEHRLVVAKALGRSLKRHEYVHHINGKKLDNRNCNLLVCTYGYHVWLHNRMAQLYAQEHF